MGRRFLICDFPKPETVHHVIASIVRVGGRIAGWSGSAARERLIEETALQSERRYAVAFGDLETLTVIGKVNPGTVNALRAFEGDTMHLLDRAYPSIRNMNTMAKRRLYHMAIGYGEEVVNETEPDLAVFSDTPHNWLSYLVYRICELRRIDASHARLRSCPHRFRSTYTRRSFVLEEWLRLLT